MQGSVETTASSESNIIQPSHYDNTYLPAQYSHLLNFNSDFFLSGESSRCSLQNVVFISVPKNRWIDTRTWHVKLRRCEWKCSWYDFISDRKIALRERPPRQLDRLDVYITRMSTPGTFNICSFFNDLFSIIYFPWGVCVTSFASWATRREWWHEKCSKFQYISR